MGKAGAVENWFLVIQNPFIEGPTTPSRLLIAMTALPRCSEEKTPTAFVRD